MKQLSFSANQAKSSSEQKTGFCDKVRTVIPGPLAAVGVNVLQVNLGYRCNMACRHCHVSAGPDRLEMMESRTVDTVLRVVREKPIETLDITGGAPEMHPRFRFLVAAARKAGKRVIIRTNLTIFFEEGMKDLPEFYREQGVEVVASLPCYLEDNVNALRGSGVFQKSIDALRSLNRLGFGQGQDGPPLNLVYNPGGPFLPPSQDNLESDYKKELRTRYGISFTRLYTFTNMPIGRFRDSLAAHGEFERYLSMLASAFNPSTLQKIMCRSLVNVGWDGTLYDCDFNQILGSAVTSDQARTIDNFDYEMLSRRTIAVNDHCYGCTAGQGST